MPQWKTTTINPVATTKSAETYERDCYRIQEKTPNAQSGVYNISVEEDGMFRASVFCDMDTTTGGWTVIQRRMDGETDFNRAWADYAAGFGNPQAEYWIGNDNLATLTTARPYTLRIVMLDNQWRVNYAEYRRFVIGGADFKYKLLSLGQFSGTAGDSLTYHVGQPFSTRDSDNDAVPTASCAEQFEGAWWYKYCLESNLNGVFNRGLTWSTLTGHEGSLRGVVMMVRPMDGDK
jgi:hypothetical protein